MSFVRQLFETLKTLYPQKVCNKFECIELTLNTNVLNRKSKNSIKKCKLIRKLANFETTSRKIIQNTVIELKKHYKGQPITAIFCINQQLQFYN